MPPVPPGGDQPWPFGKPRDAWLSNPPAVWSVEPPHIVPRSPLGGGPSVGEPIQGIDPGTDLRDLTEQEIEALLEGVGARYGLTREQLTLQQNQLGNAARAFEARLEAIRTEAISGVQSASLERGVLRSGIHARGVADINQQLAETGQAAALDRQAQGTEIDVALARLQEQQAAEQAALQTQAEQGLLQFEQGQTVASFLASLPPVPNPPGIIFPADPRAAQPILPSEPGAVNLFGGAPISGGAVSGGGPTGGSGFVSPRGSLPPSQPSGSFSSSQPMGGLSQSYIDALLRHNPQLTQLSPADIDAYLRQVASTRPDSQLLAGTRP